MKLVPAKGFVSIKAEELEYKTASGLIVANVRKNQRTGVIVSVGAEVYFLNVGDKVDFLTIHSVEEAGLFLVNTIIEDCKILFKH